MDLRNCPRCGKLFAYDGVNKLCSICRDEEENAFQKVKDYLWDHPNATIEKVHNDTGVERELIIKFIKEDRLIAEGLELDYELECERCGAPIMSGRFCKKCQQELVDGFSSSGKKKKEDEEDSIEKKGQRLHIADRITKRKEEDN